MYELWKKTMTTKISSLSFSLGLLLSTRYDQDKALVKQLIADTEHQFNLVRSPTFIASEPYRYTVPHLTNLEVLIIESPLLWHNIMPSPQLFLKADTGRFFTQRDNVPVILNM